MLPAAVRRVHRGAQAEFGLGSALGLGLGFIVERRHMPCTYHARTMALGRGAATLTLTRTLTHTLTLTLTLTQARQSWDEEPQP